MRQTLYQYEILTLSAKKIIDLEIETKHLHLDLSMNTDTLQPYNHLHYDSVVINLDSHYDNAFYYQAMKILKHSLNYDYSENSLEKITIFSELLSHLVIVDFGDLLRKNKPENIEKAERLFEKGIDICFDHENKQSTHFVPFDKSANMSRHYQIYFIDETLRDELYQRLMLGMSGFAAIKSKLYSYRGLALSSACRIPEDANFVLSEETVLILSDESLPNSDTHIVLSNSSSNDSTSRIEIQKNNKTNINCYDGVGIISPLYAKAINDRLGYNDSPSHSFQIRLPFCKGMLHELDFHRFIKSLLPNDINYKDLTIIDMYGIERKLSSIQIVLTESMLKNHKWLNKYAHNIKCSDPVALYFDRIKEYDHALYISKDDSLRFNETGKTRLNYQFLNPIGFTAAEFEQLVSSHFSIADKYADSPQDIFFMEADETIDQEFVVSAQSTWTKALLKNPSLIDDRFINRKLGELRTSIVTDTVKGKLIIDGEQRFLCPDLLGLLLHLMKKIKVTDSFRILFDGMINKYRQNCIRKNHFYMPELQHGGIRLSKDHECAILRNPHLSRNEELVMKPHVKEDDFYEHYCTHLTSTIMIPRGSSAAEALGGADFDGDIVKIISSEVLVNAVKRGLYDTNGERLPIIDISSNEKTSDEMVSSKIDFNTIINTFCNSIGYISNMAIKFGLAEYADENDAIHWEDNMSRSAECTILTGLDIDASKTGIRPDLQPIESDLSKLKNDFYVDSKSGMDSYFLNLKDVIPAISIKYKRWQHNLEETEEGGYKFIDRTNRIKYSVKPLKETTRIINKLPWYCVNKHYRDFASNTKTPSGNAEDARNRLFAFDGNLPRANDKDQTVRELVGIIDGVLKAYLDIQRESSILSRTKDSLDQSKYAGRCRNILAWQYGDTSKPLPYSIRNNKETYESIEDLYEKAYCDIYQALIDPDYISCIDDDRVQEVLKRIIDDKWIFVSPDKREEYLYQLMPNLKTSEDVITLLTNFEKSGYKLLYYIVKSLKLLADIQLENDDPYNMDNIDEPADTSIQNNSYYFAYAQFKEKMMEYHSSKKEISRLQNDLIHAIRKMITEIICSNLHPESTPYSVEVVSDAIRYVYARTKSNNTLAQLLWRMFTWEELDHVIIKNNIKENPDA